RLVGAPPATSLPHQRYGDRGDGDDDAGADRAVTLADDLLYGAAAIAEFVFGDSRERQKVYGLIEAGELPVFRLGITVCARRSTIWRSTAAREPAATTEPAVG